ncbi:hypothetical protein GN956_G15196 [Arapaima gigas]
MEAEHRDDPPLADGCAEAENSGREKDTVLRLKTTETTSLVPSRTQDVRFLLYKTSRCSVRGSCQDPPKPLSWSQPHAEWDPKVPFVVPEKLGYVAPHIRCAIWSPQTLEKIPLLYILRPSISSWLPSHPTAVEELPVCHTPSEAGEGTCR